MHRRAAKLSAILSAIALAGVTLAVFWVLREVGPASTIRRFHIAAVRGDFQEVEYLVTPDSTPAAARELVAAVQGIAQLGGQYQLASTVRPSPNLIVAEVNYHFPGGRRAELWFLQKVQGRWRINADATLHRTLLP